MSAEVKIKKCAYRTGHITKAQEVELVTLKIMCNSNSCPINMKLGTRCNINLEIDNYKGRKKCLTKTDEVPLARWDNLKLMWVLKWYNVKLYYIIHRTVFILEILYTTLLMCSSEVCTVSTQICQGIPLQSHPILSVFAGP